MPSGLNMLANAQPSTSPGAKAGFIHASSTITSDSLNCTAPNAMGETAALLPYNGGSNPVKRNSFGY